LEGTVLLFRAELIDFKTILAKFLKKIITF